MERIKGSSLSFPYILFRGFLDPGTKKREWAPSFLFSLFFPRVLVFSLFLSALLPAGSGEDNLFFFSPPPLSSPSLRWRFLHLANPSRQNGNLRFPLSPLLILLDFFRFLLRDDLATLPRRIPHFPLSSAISSRPFP